MVIKIIGSQLPLFGDQPITLTFDDQINQPGGRG